MEDQKTRLLAGVVIPDADVVRLAWEFAEARCEPYLFNHVVRSWLFATSIASIQNVEHDREVLAIGALLHDVTLNMSFRGPRRFEVEAADIAREFAIDAGLEPRRVQLVWDCVALNSTPSIGLYKEAEVSLCTAGICLDVVGLGYERVRAVEMKAITTAFPRLDLKKRMTKCFCHMAEAAPLTTYDNFLRDFGLRYVDGYSPPSSVDFVMNTPFES
ncbi:HD domain-containing protein [Sinorhizobium medicae]|uniref:HD domain-containing protein n=1 Tax=Sinorhizobium medicae TaxID=110321 RepID=UPI000FE01B57|nr:HD domain-containing protein [Sinorhizobium medicae]MBO1944844.1 HD domain-containing protein [Sinorhizobium medicae]MDX0436452.1 HD domain-containing protein [Sinorhizobium medicae]MDX0462484.1 HD domain-containing protein [Sinorhizobium medicae]MDX0487149.1 HD domain-containing protein [Sinorhizobium medicae]MDX0493734.1 HD domain-containing protein [Sinorhizobium medicae]